MHKTLYVRALFQQKGGIRMQPCFGVGKASSLTSNWTVGLCWMKIRACIHQRPDQRMEYRLALYTAYLPTFSHPLFSHVFVPHSSPTSCLPDAYPLVPPLGSLTLLACPLLLIVLSIYTFLVCSLSPSSLLGCTSRA
jgi:hypothetical protein